MPLDPAYLADLERQHRLPSGILNAVMQTESGGNPNAVSPKGALGAFQFMPATAQQYGIDPNDPAQAASGAAQMYDDLLKKYNGDVPSALGGYNWGQGNVDRQGLANAPSETKGYIQKVMAGIGNAVMPSANAAEMPDLSHLSDDELKKIASQSEQGTGQPDSAGQQPSPQGSQIGDNQQNSALSKFASLVADKPEDNYFGLIPAAKSMGRGILGMMQDISGNGQAPGSNLNTDELGALAGISPVGVGSKAALAVAEPSINKAVSAAGDLAAQTAKSDVPAVVAKTADLPVVKPTMSDQLKAQAAPLYKAVEDSGQVYSPNLTNRFLDEAQKLAPQSVAGKLTEGETDVTKLLDRWQSLRDKPLKLSDVQEIDEGLSNLADNHFDLGKPNKTGKKILDIQNKLRDMTANTMDGDISVPGNTGNDAATLKAARQRWSQALRVGDIERIIQRGETANQPATAIRQGFHSLYNSPSRMAAYKNNPELVKLIKQAAQPGLGQEALRLIGSRLTAITAGGAGFAVGGPMGTLAAEAVALPMGHIARKLAGNLQAKQGQKIIKAIVKK